MRYDSILKTLDKLKTVIKVKNSVRISTEQAKLADPWWRYLDG